MTDNEIIKALECCKGYLTNDCAMCQNVEKYPRCNEFLNEIALDLINRHKAENERLEKELMKCKLEKEMLYQTVEEIKSEAIKEFAERLKCGVPQETGVIRCDDVDNIVKEMTEFPNKIKHNSLCETETYKGGE